MDYNFRESGESSLYDEIIDEYNSAVLMAKGDLIIALSSNNPERSFNGAREMHDFVGSLMSYN